MFPQLLWLLLAFLIGALPFSVWIGRALLGRDIRRFGDGNPGATNVLRAGGRLAAMLALLLDFCKGALPVGIAHFVLNLEGWALVTVTVLPVLGHAFSPFLGWRGGKAVAVTGGVWCGLTLWEGPTVGGVLLGLLVRARIHHSWAVIYAFTGLWLYLLLTPAAWNLRNARPPLWIILFAGLGNLLILLWTHRNDLGPKLNRAHR